MLPVSKFSPSLVVFIVFIVLSGVVVVKLTVEYIYHICEMIENQADGNKRCVYMMVSFPAPLENGVSLTKVFSDFLKPAPN